MAAVRPEAGLTDDHSKAWARPSNNLPISSSRTWMSQDYAFGQRRKHYVKKWRRCEKPIKTMYGAPAHDLYTKRAYIEEDTQVIWTIAPLSFEEYVEHCDYVFRVEKLYWEKKRLAVEKTEPPVAKLMGGKRFEDNLGVVLAQETAFGLNACVPGREGCKYWPNHRRRKAEGDHRANSRTLGHGKRLLPHPSANEGDKPLPDDQVILLKMYHMDDPNRIKTREDIYKPVTQIRKEDIAMLLPSDLLSVL